MKKVLTIGSAVHDLFISYERPYYMEFEEDGQEINYILLEEGRKLEITKLHYATGGGALNSASCFTRLELPSTPCCKVGTDSYGAFIIEKIAEHGIDTSAIAHTDERKTGSSYILPSPTGNSSILVDRGANLTLSKENIPVESFSDYDQIYVTSLSRDTSELLPYITQQAKKAGIPVATNPGTSQLTANVSTLIESLPNIDILILNTVEASLLAESFFGTDKKKNTAKPNYELPDLLATPIARGDIIFTLQDYFKKIHEYGPSIAVVTNGEDGVYVSHGDYIYFHPGLPIEVESTVGAGDAFGATFVSQLLKEKSLDDAIRAGVINSAAALEQLDATSGLLDQTELDELVAEIDQNGVKKYDRE
ncbi:carbohydrate kinase family protein [Candidatus Dependentiae bacterium]